MASGHSFPQVNLSVQSGTQGGSHTGFEIFQVLLVAHLSFGHGERNRILKDFETKYKNVTRRDIELYINLCEPSEKKNQNKAKKSQEEYLKKALL
ncbi:hypothetical protein TNCV_3026911 [Trichonephila clavipes]|nr:hypothetical protein TNCV_3026911 [Trichonephila clavipes]